MANAEQQNLQQIFHQSRLNVPRYQRSYAWDEQQVDDLLDDLEYVIERQHELTNERDVVHYFGTIVLEEDKKIDSPTPNDWTLYDIVDGQQRITTISLLVGCVCEELAKLQGYVEVDTSTQNSPEELYETYRNMYIKYKNKDNGRRLTPAQLTQNAYSKLVISEQEPDGVLTESNQILPARKLARAKENIQAWLDDHRESRLENEIESARQENLHDYFSFLYDVLSAIDDIFEVTKYEVDDTAEAGRLFEVVNDRGKDLTTAEKVKSHLLYCAGEVELLDSEAVARDFNEAVEVITNQGGDEELVDQFIARHWEMFTGETNRSRPQSDINGLHRRIKQLDRYASLERDHKELANWIQTYVESLLDSAGAFYAVYDADHLQDEYSSIDDELVNRIRSIGNSGAASNFRPILMAAYLQLNVLGEDFERVVEVCETFSFRAFEVVNRSTTLLRRSLKQEAHKLYMADWTDEEIEGIFGVLTMDEIYGDVDTAVDEICRFIDEKTAERAPETDFIEHLTRNDIFQGEHTTGWGGFKNKNTILYLLYEYERNLRAGEGDTGLYSLVDFASFSEEAEVEHIAPKNPDIEAAKLEDHDFHKNRLGNQAFLWPEDNKTASNSPYDQKYEDVYSESKVATLEELPEASEGWTVESVEERESRLVDFALERWSGETTGRVIIDEELSREQENEIRSAIQDRNGVRIATIEFALSSEADVSSDEYENKETCSNCGGVYISVSDGEWTCACGSELSVPSYQISQ